MSELFHVLGDGFREVFGTVLVLAAVAAWAGRDDIAHRAGAAWRAFLDPDDLGRPE